VGAKQFRVLLLNSEELRTGVATREHTQENRPYTSADIINRVKVF